MRTTCDSIASAQLPAHRQRERPTPCVRHTYPVGTLPFLISLQIIVTRPYCRYSGKLRHSSSISRSSSIYHGHVLDCREIFLLEHCPHGIGTQNREHCDIPTHDDITRHVQLSVCLRLGRPCLGLTREHFGKTHECLVLTCECFGLTREWCLSL